MLEPIIAYIRAKFDHSRFSRSEDMVGDHQNINGLHELTTPLSEMVCHPGLALATINLPAKFEVSNSIHYEVMKGDTNKISKMGVCGN